jgi:hypothetical protein
MYTCHSDTALSLFKPATDKSPNLTKAEWKRLDDKVADGYHTAVAGKMIPVRICDQRAVLTLLYTYVTR